MIHDLNDLGWSQGLLPLPRVQCPACKTTGGLVMKLQYTDEDEEGLDLNDTGRVDEREYVELALFCDACDKIWSQRDWVVMEWMMDAGRPRKE